MDEKDCINEYKEERYSNYIAQLQWNMDIWLQERDNLKTFIYLEKI